MKLLDQKTTKSQSQHWPVTHETTKDHERVFHKADCLWSCVSFQQKLTTSLEGWEQEVGIAPIIDDLFELSFDIFLLNGWDADILKDNRY